MTISQITHTMTEDAISTAPTMPQSSDPDTFDVRGDAALLYISDMPGEYNPMIAELNDVITDVNTAIAGINSATDTINDYKDTTIAAANFKGIWADLTGSLTIPSSVYHEGVVWLLLNDLADVTSSEPTSVNTDWYSTAIANGLDVDNVVISTTLTNDSTLLNITPTGYGISVTLPDATGCLPGTTQFVINNKGGYPVRILNDSGVLKGFINANTVCKILLENSDTSTGIWSIEKNELVSYSAKLYSTSIGVLRSFVELDTDRDFIYFSNASNHAYGVIYKKSTNTFGSVTLIRSDAVAGLQHAIKSDTDQILFISSLSTAFESVVLTISGTTITPGTPDTATLGGAPIFTVGSELIQVGSSFITSYHYSTTFEIREVTISGTTPTISAATTLDGTYGGYIVNASDTHVIAVSSATTHLYTKPYAVPGLSAGTGTDSTPGANAIITKVFPLGSRWCVIYYTGTDTQGAMISHSSGTTTISSTTLFSYSGEIQDAIVVDGKVFACNDQTTNNANILIDTAGTASAGTPITIEASTTKACFLANSTDAYVCSGTTTFYIFKIDCSGTSPVVTDQISASVSNTVSRNFLTSDPLLHSNPWTIYATNFAMTCSYSTTFRTQLLNGSITQQAVSDTLNSIVTKGAFTTDSVRWGYIEGAFITKVEAAQ